MAHLPRQQQHLSSSPVTFCNSHAPLYEIYMRRFPGSGPGLSAPPCRVLPSAVGLLSMNIQRPPPLSPLSSSSSSALYVSPWLRLFLRSGFLSLSLAHTYTHSLPRSSIASIFVHLRNHQELPTSRSGRGGLRTTNENKTRTERTTLYSFLLFSCCCFPPIFPPFYLFFDSNMRAKPF